MRRLALCLLVFALPGDARAGHWAGRYEVTGLAVTPDGRALLVAGMDGRVRLLDLNRRRERAAVLAHKGGIWALALSGDGRHFITSGADRLARIWELARVKEVLTYEGHRSAVSAVALSADGRLAASGDYTGAVHLWDAATGKVRFRQAVNGFRATGLAFSPDSSLLVGGSVEQGPTPESGPNKPSRLCLWQVADGTKEVLAETGEVVHFLPGHGGLVASCSIPYTVDAKGATSPYGGSQTILWDPWRKCRPFRLKNYYHGLAVSPDGRYIATSWGSYRFHESSRAQKSPARGIHLWELASGKEVWARSVKEDDATVMAFTPNGRTLIAGRQRGTLAYHDLRPEGWQPPARWGEADFARAWQALGRTSPTLAYTAVWDLAARSDGTVRWLLKRWKPVSQEERARRLLAELDSDDFAEREKARRALEELAEEAEPVLRAALAKPVSAEVRQAVQRLLARLKGVASPARLRQLRVLTILERIGTTEARRLLHDLARGPAGTDFREQARLAEGRLAARLGR
jgi:hypothetical protein